MAYQPKGNGRRRDTDRVAFTEMPPPPELSGLIHRILHLQTTAPLDQDYCFHALPDACTYLVLDQSDPRVAGFTRLSAASEEFNLGRTFHFVNVRFLPGVWAGDLADLAFGQLTQPYEGPLPLVDVNRAIHGKPFVEQIPLIADLVTDLADQGVLRPNPAVDAILAQLEDLHTVADMAEASGLSPRQLQRVLRRDTGFSPHDFLKVLRLQEALRGDGTWSYADQSHYIHAFRRATGYTPGKYAKDFDV